MSRVYSLNVCINGTYRYPGYIRYFGESGHLNKFYFSHRIKSNAQSLGLRQDQLENIFLKEYALHAALRIAPSMFHTDLMLFFGDRWQNAVISRWSDCDIVQTVIGQVSDRILTHAKSRGSATVGHSVNSHPAALSKILNDEYDRLEIKSVREIVSDRRLEEIESCDELLVDSNFVARSFIENGVPEKRVNIVTPGSDLQRFSPRVPSERDRSIFRVVSVGALSPRKGHLYLLAAWKLLRLKNAELIIVGSSAGAAPHIFRSYKGTFTYRSFIPNSELRPLLTSASVFVLPSIEDGFAQAAMEALSCGVPVITTTNTGNADVIVEGFNGYIVPPRDPQSLAEKLQRFYDDQVLAEEMGINAGEMARRKFDWADYVDAVVKLQQRLYERSR
jgi:glycosyltransferase involved in cell wall biosynthesis